MERIAHMSHMQLLFEYFSSFGDRQNKKNKTKRRKILVEKKREKCQLEERSKFERNSFDHHRREERY